MEWIQLFKWLDAVLAQTPTKLNVPIVLRQLNQLLKALNGSQAFDGDHKSDFYDDYLFPISTRTYLIFFY